MIALLGQVSNLFSDRQVETSRSPSSHPEDNSPTLRLVDIFQAQPYAVMQNIQYINYLTFKQEAALSVYVC